MLSVPGSGGAPSPGFGAGEAGSGSGGDFLTRYRLVSAKLRRRFLRKPNVSEAGEQFAALARELRGNELRAASEPGQAVPALLRAADLLAAAHLPLEAVRCLRDVASCLLLCRDHDGALAVLTQAQLLVQGGAGLAGPAAAAPASSSSSSSPASLPPGAFLDELLHCEVTRVLLLLLLQPPPSKLLPEHAQTLEKYSWEALDASPGYLPPELFLLLQSAVMACQEKDLEALKVLQKELWPLLNAEQNHLVHLVVQEMISPSGQGF
ncbi:PREDICTED: factor VIII intron 22 protein-like [Gekko japonicus]|uniref:Factor VIII intron 22 protein-like n=1 Tax=Gekko japonicus TaxID=146911 RepID=A0ABM1KQJ2_GEKJA|nr:PREDICTED: factor VIII intron 22 protein-like [Gekko japonicus]